MKGVLRGNQPGAIALDASACTACGTCEIVCSSRLDSISRPRLSCITLRCDLWTGGRACDVCLHCRHPACLSACPEGAILQDAATGATYIDPSSCKGCGSCYDACPLTPERPVIKYRLEQGKRIYFKCDLCHASTDGPLCLLYCPTGALSLVPAPGRRRRDKPGPGTHAAV